MHLLGISDKVGGHFENGGHLGKKYFWPYIQICSQGWKLQLCQVSCFSPKLNNGFTPLHHYKVLSGVKRNWKSWFYRVFLINLDTLFQNTLLSKSQNFETCCVVKYNKMFFGRYDSVYCFYVFTICLCLFKTNVGWTYTCAVYIPLYGYVYLER